MTYTQYDDFPYWAEIKVNGDAVTLRKVKNKGGGGDLLAGDGRKRTEGFEGWVGGI